MTTNVVHAKVLTAIPLIQKAIDSAMVLGVYAGFCLKAERDIEGGVPSRLNQDELSQRQCVFVMPNLRFLKLFQLF
jgi:hypothetical protein